MLGNDQIHQQQSDGVSDLHSLNIEIINRSTMSFVAETEDGDKLKKKNWFVKCLVSNELR